MKNNSKFQKFLNGKGFYAALGICMIAIGISAFTAIKGISKAPDTSKITSENSKAESEAANITSSEPYSKTESKNSKDGKKSTSSSDKAESAQQKGKTDEAVNTAVAKYFLYPLNGEILKPFSLTELKYSLTYNDMRLHTGIDIKAKAGDSVKSCGDGVVTFAGSDPSLGYTVKIDHGNGITGIYAGLNKAIAVKKGDSVTAGSNLGPLGTVTGECLDASHLHLEFIKDKKPIDPLSLLTDR